MVCEWLDRVWALIVSSWGLLGDIWAWVVSVAPTVGAVCTFIITAYPFYLTVYPKKLKFLDYAIFHSAFWGDTIKVSLENRSLASVCVKNIWLNIDDEHRIQLFSEFEDGYRIIDSFHAETFASKPYTQLFGKNGQELRVDPGTAGKFWITVETSRGKQQIIQKIKPAPFPRKVEVATAHKFTQTFNDIVISKDMAYGLVYYDINQTKHNVLVHKSGAMSEAIGETHRVPDNLMQDEKKLRQFFDRQFRILGCAYTLQPIARELSVKKPPKKVIVRKKS